MSRLKVRRPRVSRFRLSLALRWQSFFASWLLTRSERRLTKEQKRLTLLLQATDSSLLRLKELEQAQQMAQHRLQEMAESRQFRETGQLPPSPTMPLLEESSTPRT